MPRLSPCLDCGAPCSGPRCKGGCQQAHDSARNQRRQWYRNGWQTTRTRILTEWRATHGDWCPGLPPHHPPHPSTDLTVDHITPRSTDQGLRVLCRAINSARGNR